MPNKDNKAYDFLCTLKESTAQIVDSALNAFNESVSTINWDNLDADQRKAVQGWHIDLQKANQSITENNA